MDPSMLISDGSGPNQPKFRNHSQAEISKALALLGFGSWASLEPKAGQESGGYVKDRLDEALRNKVDEIEEKRIAEEAEKAKFEKMSKQQKDQYKLKNRAKLEKKKKKTLFMEERDIHESYQLLLSEHHKRVKQRTKQKLAVVASLMSKSSLNTNDNNTNNNNANGNGGNKSDAKLNPWQQRGLKSTQSNGKQDDKDATRLSKSKSFTNRKQKLEEKSNPENGPKKIEVTIPKVPTGDDSAGNTKNEEGGGPTHFRNKVKLIQTKTMLSNAFGDGGAERFAARKMRMESNLGINVGNNLS